MEADKAGNGFLLIFFYYHALIKGFKNDLENAQRRVECSQVIELLSQLKSIMKHIYLKFEVCMSLKLTCC